ncbi:hypothetical protein [Hyalangium rubrum]|uniref:Uncharacterized protein n=1 Tax=Hyalangium rubrum TaxID=3103134 RepID=A0ABU5GX75_9BACT|nr:hypothetical protein [Hyalangium sp. s54d21]MDY7225631.1 hypothetical protein [Hyalangium sp. s54d21]
MKRVGTQSNEKQHPGRVLGRVLAEELEQVRGGTGLPLADATAGQTVDPHGHLDLTGGRRGQTDGD